MKINYKGYSTDYNYRVAEIMFDEDSKKENYLIDELRKKFKIHDYEVEIVTNGYALIYVSEYEEYKDVVKLYKQFKKSSLLFYKFYINK